ncbi:hypothetical protein GCM10011380_21240 [Sphingomonas metalli]|uniref:Uncharacterized protein n=1 Tax=Sphingomonas metalli TaxID=1779358 RepID=A0A916T4D2_9SPHN|nr:hypothetical protein GCM10011380_21240 [Sphingomonas metalli]
MSGNGARGESGSSVGVPAAPVSPGGDAVCARAGGTGSPARRIPAPARERPARRTRHDMAPVLGFIDKGDNGRRRLFSRRPPWQEDAR